MEMLPPRIAVLSQYGEPEVRQNCNCASGATGQFVVSQRAFQHFVTDRWLPLKIDSSSNVVHHKPQLIAIRNNMSEFWRNL